MARKWWDLDLKPCLSDASLYHELKEGIVRETVSWVGGKRAGHRHGVDLPKSNNLVPEGRRARAWAPRMK